MRRVTPALLVVVFSAPALAGQQAPGFRDLLAAEGARRADGELAAGQAELYSIVLERTPRDGRPVAMPSWVALRLVHRELDASTRELKDGYAGHRERVEQWLDENYGAGLLQYEGQLERLSGEVARALEDGMGAGGSLARADLAAGRRLRIRVGPVDRIELAREELLFREMGVLTVEINLRLAQLRAFAEGYNAVADAALLEGAGEGRMRELARRAAVQAAELDIAAGRLMLLRVGGPPQPWELRRDAILKERFGIEVLDLGCVPPGHDRSPYEQRMRREIERRFGPGALDAAQREAQAAASKG